jgi:sugar lactone lactonase YvrE
MSPKQVMWKVLGAGAVVASALVAPHAASAATLPLSNPRIVAHFNLAETQNAENLAILKNGEVDVTFAYAHQVGQVGRNGDVRIVATLPVPADGGVNTPLTGKPFLGGIAQSRNGTVYVAYSTGSADLTGIWRLRSNGSPVRVAGLPPTAFLNGLAIDNQTGTMYIADSVLGVVWRVPAGSSTASVWATGSQLGSSFGPNGIKVHDGAVWVTNTTLGLLVRIPIKPDGRAGSFDTKAIFPAGELDDFAFTGQGDSILAALNGPNEVVLIQPDGTETVVLTAADGLEGPSAVGVLGRSVYITSAAYNTKTDPNLLLATLTPTCRHS